MSPSRPLRKPEIMSPAGYWPQLKAAIEAGADSVYFGLKHFTARAKVGFDLEELPEVMRTLHQRGVRGFVTFNTLIFENELSEAAQAIAGIAEAGADALIIQDVGVAKLARQIAPQIELHASTQMSITDASGVRFAQQLGMDRVTLARELSLVQIEAILLETDCELEMFVHGALCVAYSGQCFSSEAWGGRSANRGQCAQACRLPYELISDGEPVPLADARYLLSPGDLYALEHIPAIVRLGLSALKIEGRYKDAEYVALATSSYRRAVDEAWAGVDSTISRAEKLQLEQSYSRGLGPFFLTGTDHQAVVNGRAPRHRGVWMGRVLRVESDRILIRPGEAHSVSPLKAGDGVVFDSADWRSPEEREEGGRLYGVETASKGNLLLQFANGTIAPHRIREGDLVWRTSDPNLPRTTRPFTEAVTPVSQQPVSIRVEAREGQLLKTEWGLERDANGLSVDVFSQQPLSRAQNRALNLATVQEQLGRLGNTAYRLDRVELVVEGEPFVPVSLLNQIRREAVERLQAVQSAPPAPIVRNPVTVLQSARSFESAASFTDGIPNIHLLVRNDEQLNAALQVRPASITLDYLDLYGLRPSVMRVRESGIRARVATPRVLKPEERKILDFLLGFDCDILVRNIGMLGRLTEGGAKLIGDFSLNAANSLSARVFLTSGLSRLTPTHDLNAAQVAALASTVGNQLEAIAYQHLPVFHTEHCVFCRFLSTGTSYKDCGRPCEKHAMALRDPQGRAHPVIADVGCRNTVFGAEAQEASAYLEDWVAAGIRDFRLEFVHETADDVVRIAEAFRLALLRTRSFSWLREELKALSKSGVTNGSWFVPNEENIFRVLQ